MTAAILAASIGCAVRQPETPQVAAATRSVTVCELLSDTGRFNDATVAVKGTYRYGVEWQDLYCLECLDQGLIWVEFGHKVHWPHTAPKHQGTINVAFIGVFHAAGGRYGHQNGYSAALQVTRVQSADVIARSGAHPNALSAEARRRVCQH
jgi:hypothetical protein